MFFVFANNTLHRDLLEIFGQMVEAGDDAAFDRALGKGYGEHTARECLHLLHPGEEGGEGRLCLLAVTRDIEDGIAEEITLTE